MVNFIICENDVLFRKMLTDKIRQYMNEKRIEGQIVLKSGCHNEVISYVKKDVYHRNIYLLDICLGNNISGIALAKEIRKYDIFSNIIFVTSYLELCIECFRSRIKALDFIVKGEDIESRLYDSLDIALKELMFHDEKMKLRSIIIKSNNSMHKVPLDHIICIETLPGSRKLVIHTLSERILFYGTLKGIQEKLDGTFCKIHKSYIINTSHISTICHSKADTHVIMKKEIICPLSRTYIKTLLERMDNFQ